MMKQFGATQFTKGYELIKQNKNILYDENGEEQLIKLLKPLGFSDIEQVKAFINYCTTYIIVQSMQ